MELKSLPSSVSPMKRVISVSSGFISVSYQCDGKEVGHLSYRLFEGSFGIAVWPSDFSALTRIAEYMKVLGYARKLVKDEVL